MSVEKKRVIGKPAGRISLKRVEIFKKAVREVMAMAGNSHRSGSQPGTCKHRICARDLSLAQHLKSFGGSRPRRVKALSKR